MPIVTLIFVSLYVVTAWLGVRWLRRSLNQRHGAVRDSLAQHGARVLSFHEASSLLSPAGIEFELGGQRGRITRRWWGRSMVKLTLQIDSAPRPGIWIRQPGRALDGLSRALGFERLVQLDGRPVSVATRASDATVDALLGAPEVSRRVHELVDASGFAAFVGVGHLLAIGPEGVSISLLASIYSPFDPNAAVPILERLEALDRILPHVGSAEITPLVTSRPAVVSALAPTLILAPAVVVAFALGHYPMAGSVIDTVLLAGLGLVPVAWLCAWRHYRGRPSALRELVATGLGLAMVIPFLTMEGLTVVNYAFDTSPPATHRVRVLDYYKHNSHTVYVESWTQGVTREKVIVPRSIPRVAPGDTLEVTTRAGALGWMWTAQVVKL